MWNVISTYRQGTQLGNAAVIGRRTSRDKFKPPQLPRAKVFVSHSYFAKASACSAVVINDFFPDVVSRFGFLYPNLYGRVPWSVYPFLPSMINVKFPLQPHQEYIYLIDRVRGPYWQNIGPRSWQYGPSRFGEVRTKKTEGRYSPSTARANSGNKRFITRLLVSEKTRTANATSIQRAKIAKIKLIVFVGFLVQL